MPWSATVPCSALSSVRPYARFGHAVFVEWCRVLDIVPCSAPCHLSAMCRVSVLCQVRPCAVLSLVPCSAACHVRPCTMSWPRATFMPGLGLGALFSLVLCFGLGLCLALRHVCSGLHCFGLVAVSSVAPCLALHHVWLYARFGLAPCSASWRHVCLWSLLPVSSSAVGLW